MKRESDSNFTYLPIYLQGHILHYVSQHRILDFKDTHSTTSISLQGHLLHNINTMVLTPKTQCTESISHSYSPKRKAPNILLWTDFIGFWWWCIAHRITGFLDIFHHPVFSRVGENDVLETGSVCVIRWREGGETPTQLAWLRLALSMGAQPSGCLLPPPHHLRMETDPVSETSCFPTLKNTRRWEKLKIHN
jgi:hypothetical protein